MVDKAWTKLQSFVKIHFGLFLAYAQAVMVMEKKPYVTPKP